MTESPGYHLLRRYERSPEKLRAAVQADPAIRAEIEAEINLCRLIPDERCHMTRDYRKILEEALV